MDNVDYDQLADDYGWLFGTVAFSRWPVLRERDALRLGQVPPR